MANVAKDLAQLISQSKTTKTGPYDTQATVKRVEGNTVWVSIPGGIDETPVDKTVNCSAGDKVQVRVSGGRAWITGNASAPPTDDTTAIKARTTANEAQVLAVDAKETADAVEGIAVEANETAQQADTKADNALSQVGSSITTDTLHYLATSADSGVTINTPGWTTTVQSMDSTNRYLWTYHTYHKASGQSINTQPVITGVYGQQGAVGADGTSIKYVFIRDNWTQSGWSTRTVGTTMQVTPKNYNSSGTASNPPGYDYQNVKVGDLIMVTGTATDTKVAWTNTYKVNTAPGSSAADIPSTCQSHVYADRGAPGSDGDDGVSITAVQPQYYLSTSSSSATGGAWSTTLTYETGKYIWTRDKISYSNNTTGYSTAIYNSALTGACSTAEQALNIAEGVDEHFWYDNTGAHVTQVTQEDWNDSQSAGYHSGGNTLITSQGMAIRNGMTELATFGANGAVIGKNANGESRSEVSTSGMQIIQNVSGTDTPIANIGYGPGTNSGGGTSDAPYYTLGVRTGSVGNYSTAEGNGTEASRFASHAEGGGTTASGGYSHAEGYETTASGAVSHAEGYKTTASGDWSHAEGQLTVASDECSHAEGLRATASGLFAHAEGMYTTASGNYSHAQNIYTKASSDYQTALGKYNIEDNADTYACIIGNGTADNARSNALTVEWSGNVKAAGDITDGTGNVLGNKLEASSLVVDTDISITDNISVSSGQTSDGNKSIAKTGYTPLGVVGYRVVNASSSGTNAAYGVISHAYITGNTAYYRVRNTGNAAMKVRIYFNILYVKS